MKIDFHTHIWPHQIGYVDEFVESLDGAGIDKAVVMPIAPHGSNEDIANCVEQAPDRLIGFASVMPMATPMRQTNADPVSVLEDAVVRLGLRGLKLHPIVQGFEICDPGIAPTVDAAGELGIPVLIHTGPAYARTGRLRNADIELIDDLAIMCPRTTLIAGHGDPLLVGPHLARKHPNVYLETSGAWADLGRLLPGLALRAVEVAGKEKVLFGTDYSIGKEERFESSMGVLNDSGMASDWLEAVYGGNAWKLLATNST